ncbi:MAG: SDR family oxidoreductase [SAR86 cluster bacterium]|jgi:NAD(P)-dependent dehydrogenase (short-subunit alcohol dehydrogenase family)|nr:SDR family oxidoreductase [SAR86 cluster bacterium]
MSNLLEGRKAVITGAASGIGAASALLFAENGAEVLAFDMNPEIENIYKENNKITGLVQDISNQDAARNILNHVETYLGGLDILMNNAGVISNLPISEVSSEEWSRVFKVNVDANIEITKSLMTLIKNSSQGRVINIGSIMSSLGDANLPAYTASKHAVAGLTKSLAFELGNSQATANYIQPGSIVTGMTKDAIAASEEFTNFWIERAALKRLGQPEDIAKGALFLASDLSSFVSGHGLVIDGGALVAASW